MSSMCRSAQSLIAFSTGSSERPSGGSYGGPEALEIEELPLPDAGPGQGRIRVRAAAVNPVDVFVRSGIAAQAGMLPARTRVGIGWDVAGEVDAVGPADGSAFAVGD